MRLMDVPPFDDGNVNVIIETPKGRRNKFSYDEKLELFRLTSPLPGIITARQTERDGRVERNDRLVAIAASSREYGDVNTLEQLPKSLVDEIQHFFISYNEAKGKKFEVVGKSGPETARSAIDDALIRP